MKENWSEMIKMAKMEKTGKNRKKYAEN